MENTPAISVVIPMYNAEKYLGECLDSILMQTFQDFEVIIVNDCSTDNCRQVAESYLEKFGGRLRIYDNEKNSGAGVTRNNGLFKACGEYVFFMDADDLILSYGLERIYQLAEYFGVDFVNSTRNYRMSNNGKELTVHNLRPTRPEDKPILENNLKWRIERLLADDFAWAPWRRLIRREFLLENEIFFPDKVLRNEDEIWTIGLMFCAKKVLHIPLTIILYRLSDNSITRLKRTQLQNVNSRINNVIYDLNWIDKMLDKVPFFNKNPQYRYIILEYSTKRFFTRIFKECKKVSPPDMYLSIKEEFGKIFGEHELIVPVLCTMISSYRKIIEEDKTKIAELEEQLKAKRG